MFSMVISAYACSARLLRGTSTHMCMLPCAGLARRLEFCVPDPTLCRLCLSIITWLDLSAALVDMRCC